jgi:hypothetical protein
MFEGFEAELNEAIAAATIVDQFTKRWSWYLPWFVPKEYEAAFSELADKVNRAAKKV